MEDAIGYVGTVSMARSITSRRFRINCRPKLSFQVNCHDVDLHPTMGCAAGFEGEEGTISVGAVGGSFVVLDGIEFRAP